MIKANHRWQGPGMGRAESESLRKAVVAVALVCCSVALALYVLCPKAPPDLQDKAEEAILVSWVRARSFDHWASGTPFLPDGEYQLGETYRFTVVVTSDRPSTGARDLVSAVVRYDSNDRSVSVELPSGNTTYFGPQMDTGGGVTTQATESEHNTRTKYLRMYGS